MKINLDSETMDILMPICRQLDIPPYQLVKQIIIKHSHKFSTKKVNENDDKNKE